MPYKNNVHSFSADKIMEAINLFCGDLKAAAQALEVSHKSLTEHIYNVPRLRAMFLKEFGDGGGVVPDEVETMLRDIDIPGLRANDPLARESRAIRNMNLDVMTDGLSRAGIGQHTIDKLKDLGGFEAHAGMFLVGSLDMMHRMLVYSGVSLMEQAEFIKENHLNDSSLPMKERLAWQRMYNQITDMMGKTYDRILSGTQAMVKITRKGDDVKKLAKPAFRPLGEKNKGGNHADN